MDNQSQQPMQPQYSAPVVGSQQKQKGKGKTVVVTILFLLLLGGAGFLGLTYKSTNDSLKKQSTELSKSYKTIENFQKIIDSIGAENAFVAKYNDAGLSNSNCGGKQLGMFDVHVNSKFAVYRFLCAETSYPIPTRVAAFKKLPDGTYEFTYGASTINPSGLPGYIYDSEPEFFGKTYGVTRY